MEFLQSKELEEFYNNYDKLHPDEETVRFRNIYELKSVDMDGNVVEQKFALNLMTNNGLYGAYRYGYWIWNDSYRRIWIGDGTDTPTFTNKQLYSRITSSDPGGVVGNYDWSDSDLNRFDGMRYDKTTKICSMTRKACYCYYDYNINDLDGNVITVDRYIREIGIGDAWDNLVTHAQIYDSEGNLSSITKKPNQRLYITAYVTTTMDPSFITENYNNGIFMAVDMRPFVKTVANERIENIIYTNVGYTSNHQMYESLTAEGYRVPFYGTSSANGSWNVVNEDDGTVTFTTHSSSSFLQENKRAYYSEAETGCQSWGTCCTDSPNNSYRRYSGIFEFHNIHNEEAEDLENIVVYTDGRGEGSLKRSFGMPYSGRRSNGRIPALDGDITGAYMYNHTTKQYDIEEDFVNNPTLNLYDYCMKRRANVWMYVTFMNANKVAYVFINPYTDRPITSFANSGFTLYATNEYWDTESWEIIPNLKSIPENLGTKRYYISLVDPTSWSSLGSDIDDYLYYHYGRVLIPQRAGDTYHSITPKHPYKKYTLPYKNAYSESTKTASNDEYGYVAYGGCIFYPEHINPDTELPYAYPLKADGDTNIDEAYVFGFDKGDKIFVGGRCDNRKSYGNTPPTGRIGEYHPNPFGSIYVGFRVYSIGDDYTEAPTYQDYVIPVQNDSYFYRTTGYWSMSVSYSEASTFFKYEMPIITSSNKGFVVISGMYGYNWNNTHTQWPYPTLVNLYGGEDENTVEMHNMMDCYMAIAVDRSNYVCGWMKDESESYKFGIYDATSLELINTFSFESPNVVCGFQAWKKYVYFLTKNNGARMSWVYNIETNVLEYLPTEDFSFLDGLCEYTNGSVEVRPNSYGWNSRSYRFSASEAATDNCVVFSSNENNGNSNAAYPCGYVYGNKFFTDETNHSPTHDEYVLPAYDIGNQNGNAAVYRGSTAMKYLNGENKQLIFASGGYNRLMVQDMGLRIDKPEIYDSYYPYSDFSWFDNNTGPAVALFKDRVFMIKTKTGTVWEIPIEYCVTHKLDISTRTITAWNNPFRISSNPGGSMVITNRLTDTPSTTSDETNTE